MTQPALPEEPPDEVTALELAAVAAVVGGLAAVLAPALAAILAAWALIRDSATPEAGLALRSSTIRKIQGLAWAPMAPALREQVNAGQELGMERAVDQLPRQARPAREQVRPRLPARPPVTLDAEVQERLEDSVRMARALPMTSHANVMAVIGRASSAKSLAEGTTRWSVYEAMSRGVAAVARASGRNLIWVPERDACLHCLAHAGWVVAPGKPFPKGLTYGDRPLDVRVWWPPLHPNCRCEVMLTELEPGRPSRDRSKLDPAARLAAEARRSVVLGWTDHASNAATMRAMDRLLRMGADLPASVEARARRALAAGELPRRPK